MERGQEHQPSQEEQIVAAEMARATAEDGEISDQAARIVASRWHGGQGSAMYSFASTGAIDRERLADEYVMIYVDPHTTEAEKRQLDFLGTYWLNADGRDENGNRGPVEGWHESTRW